MLDVHATKQLSKHKKHNYALTNWTTSPFCT